MHLEIIFLVFFLQFSLKFLWRMNNQKFKLNISCTLRSNLVGFSFASVFQVIFLSWNCKNFLPIKESKYFVIKYLKLWFVRVMTFGGFSFLLFFNGIGDLAPRTSYSWKKLKDFILNVQFFKYLSHCSDPCNNVYFKF